MGKREHSNSTRMNLSVTPPLMLVTRQSINQSINEFTHPSLSQPTSQSMNPSVNNPINQATSLSLPTCVVLCHVVACVFTGSDVQWWRGGVWHLPASTCAVVIATTTSLPHHHGRQQPGHRTENLPQRFHGGRHERWVIFIIIINFEGARWGNLRIQGGETFRVLCSGYFWAQSGHFWSTTWEQARIIRGHALLTINWKTTLTSPNYTLKQTDPAKRGTQESSVVAQVGGIDSLHFTTNKRDTPPYVRDTKRGLA